MSTEKSPLNILIKRMAIERADLTREETSLAFDCIFDGSESDITIASFLTALAMKGESDAEIMGTYDAVKKHEYTFGPVGQAIIDICGTGGEASKTFNISTAAAVVTTASGCQVAKHGNRSMSGICGSADFLETIGFDLNSSQDRLIRLLENVGMVFLFSPNFHPSIKRISIVRRAIGIRTVLNIVGPLCNPCVNLRGQLIGVSKPTLLQQVSNLMKNSTLERFMVVYSEDGFDELTNTCPNRVVYFNQGELSSFTIHPKDFDLTLADKDSLTVTSKEECVRITLESICGHASKQIEDSVVLNSAAALLVGNRVDSLSEGIELARNQIANGNAHGILHDMIKCCGDEATLQKLESNLLKSP
jgi:anthranilate phosphoribosyltransferase